MPHDPVADRFRTWRRKRARPRSKTLALRDLTSGLTIGNRKYPYFDDADYDRPKVRGDCKGGQRPCPWVSCKYHLYLDVNPGTGSIKINFPDVEVEDMKDSCALDLADVGALTLEEVGEIYNLTRERVRQVETRGLHQLKGVAPDKNTGESFVPKKLQGRGLWHITPHGSRR